MILLYFVLYKYSYWTCNMCPSVYNGQMSDMNNSGEKKLKDTYKNPLKDTSFVLSPVVPPWLDHSGSYSKVHKLITALYIVTDIIDKEEPIRNKLRILGIEILSDTSSMSKTLFDTVKIDQ